MLLQGEVMEGKGEEGICCTQPGKVIHGGERRDEVETGGETKREEDSTNKQRMKYSIFGLQIKAIESLFKQL